MGITVTMVLENKLDDKISYLAQSRCLSTFNFLPFKSLCSHLVSDTGRNAVSTRKSTCEMCIERMNEIWKTKR